MRVGIQGDRGSACDAAADLLLREAGTLDFDYLIDAERVLTALVEDRIDAAVLAAESPPRSAFLTVSVINADSRPRMALQTASLASGLERREGRHRVVAAAAAREQNQPRMADFAKFPGVPVPETAEALARHPGLVEIAELRSEVRHCLMVGAAGTGNIKKVASHPVPLRKHAEFLASRYPGYRPIQFPDTAAAAKALAAGALSFDTAVIALPRAAEVYGLRVVEHDLPANDNYFTRFVLAKKAP